jgi:hypothetical protein
VLPVLRAEELFQPFPLLFSNTLQVDVVPSSVTVGAVRSPVTKNDPVGGVVKRFFVAVIVKSG